MRASRLLSMMILLQARGRLSAASLAREFEVSVRTIYRDVDALSAAGVPVYAEPGRNGGVALLEGYRTRLTGMTAAETAALPLAGLGRAARDLGLGHEAAAAQLKLMASLPEAWSANAQRVAARFLLDPVPWYHRSEAPACLPVLAAAVWRDQRVRIAYEAWNGRIRRTLSPLGLANKGGVWYLVAAARRTPRTYRVANIVELQVLDEAVPPPERFDLDRYWNEWTAGFEARLKRETARVRISAEGRRILRAENSMAAERIAATARPHAADWVEGDFPVESVAYSARQLLRLGAEVEVLGPPELRQAMADEARAVLTLYAAS